jgi:hypothetical protein
MQMMKLIPVKAECYSGYIADEYPRCFTLKNEKFEIREVTDRWYQGETNPEYPVSNYFKVKTMCGKEFILKHDLQSDIWYLCK